MEEGLVLVPQRYTGINQAFSGISSNLGTVSSKREMGVVSSGIGGEISGMVLEVSKIVTAAILDVPSGF